MRRRNVLQGGEVLSVPRLIFLSATGENASAMRPFVPIRQKVGRREDLLNIEVSCLGRIQQILLRRDLFKTKSADRSISNRVLHKSNSTTIIDILRRVFICIDHASILRAEHQAQQFQITFSQ